jgi:CRP-like cAMP-binding protein
MYIKQSDLFLGLNHHFVKEIMAIAQKESHAESQFVFRLGEPADHFYILINGQVQLSLGDSGQVVYTSSNVGETFGWSSLIGRDSYSASALCLQPTDLLKIERHKLQNLLEKDTDSGYLFFKQLAEALGNRLLQLYQSAL